MWYNLLSLSVSSTFICLNLVIIYRTDFPGGAVVKNPPANAGDARNVGLIPGLGRFPGGEHGNPFQYSCLENPMDRGAWQATVHGVTKKWTKPGTGWACGITWNVSRGLSEISGWQPYVTWKMAETHAFPVGDFLSQT